MSTLKVNTINASTSGQAVDVDIKNPKSFRNKVINGGMLVNQRGNQSSVTTSVYGLDRFKVQEAADVTYDINQSTDTPDGFGNSFHIDIQGAQASPSASHFMQLMTALEGFDVQDFAKGTSGAKQYTVSFYVKTNVTGNYALQITDDNSRSCSQLYTVSDTNWNRYTVTFPADTTGAIDNDNSEGLRLTWHLLVGTDRSSGTMNTTWAATTTANIAAGQNANVASSTSNNWYITGVQLEVGSVATDFEFRSFAEELQLCKRYCQVLQTNATGSPFTRFAVAIMQTTSSIRAIFNLSPEMRAIPSATKSGNFQIFPASGFSSGSFNIESGTSNFNTAIFLQSSGMSGTAGSAHYFSANSDADAKIIFDAEL